MATPAASYRNPQPIAEQKESNCSMRRQAAYRHIARDLEELCDMGLVEKFRDEHNIIRYRPTNGRVA